MIRIPTTQRRCVLIGIDPGTTKLGVARLEMDAETLEITNISAKTINADKLPQNTWIAYISGPRAARLLAIQNELEKELLEHQPIYVVSESPFFNPRMPGAAFPLVETLTMIRGALTDYAKDKSLYTIEPSNVKKAIEAKSQKGKDAVRDALLTHPLIKEVASVDLTELDEHAIDAIAVVYGLHTKLVEGKIEDLNRL